MGFGRAEQHCTLPSGFQSTVQLPGASIAEVEVSLTLFLIYKLMWSLANQIKSYYFILSRKVLWCGTSSAKQDNFPRRPLHTSVSTVQQHSDFSRFRHLQSAVGTKTLCILYSGVAAQLSRECWRSIRVFNELPCSYFVHDWKLSWNIMKLNSLCVCFRWIFNEKWPNKSDGLCTKQGEQEKGTFHPTGRVCSKQ